MRQPHVNLHLCVFAFISAPAPCSSIVYLRRACDKNEKLKISFQAYYNCLQTNDTGVGDVLKEKLSKILWRHIFYANIAMVAYWHRITKNMPL